MCIRDSTLGVGEYSNIKNLGLNNNDLSSLRVPAGLQVTLYNISFFRGDFISFTADDNCLINNSFDDKTGSLIITDIGEGRVVQIEQLYLSQLFGQKTSMDWFFYQEETRPVDKYILKHGTSEYKELSVISTVSASDLIGLEQYNFIHEDPSVGINYYQIEVLYKDCLLYTSPSPRDATLSRMPSSA